jgi:hypothetical protein
MPRFRAQPDAFQDFKSGEPVRPGPYRAPRDVMNAPRACAADRTGGLIRV